MKFACRTFMFAMFLTAFCGGCASPRIQENAIKNISTRLEEVDRRITQIHIDLERSRSEELARGAKREKFYTELEILQRNEKIAPAAFAAILKNYMSATDFYSCGSETISKLLSTREHN